VNKSDINGNLPNNIKKNILVCEKSVAWTSCAVFDYLQIANSKL